MMEKLNFILILSEFDDLFGPAPKVSFPELDDKEKGIVASKSINIIGAEDKVDSKSLAFLPFPDINKKGIVRNFEWSDATKRGGIGTGALTLVFEESDDMIYYKYIKDLEIIFNESVKKITKLKNKEAKNSIILKEIEDIHNIILLRLAALRNQELGTREVSEEFPDEDKAESKEIPKFKIIVCGDPACGKTSSILKFTDSAFRRTYIPTVGVNITRKEVKIQNKLVYLVLWDIAGHIKFQRMRSQFYGGAKGILLLFDTTRLNTFNSIPSWYNDIKSSLKSEEEPFVLLCGNKIDLVDQRKVSTEKVDALMNEMHLEYLETSALSGQNINQAFHRVAEAALEVFEKSRLK